MRVLLVDSDGGQGADVAELLKDQNLDVRQVNDADAAVEAMQDRTYRVVVIENGVAGGASALTQRLRAGGFGTPVVVLSDSPTPTSMIELLDCGVDDVLVRPFPPELLPAQIRSLLRRCAPNEGAVLKFEDLSIDLRSLQVTRQGQAIASTSRELAVLEYLMRNRQRVISRAELADAIWNDETLPGSNVIEVFIARLRRKVDRPFTVPLIHTVVGRGYMMSVTKPGTDGTADAASA